MKLTIILDTGVKTNKNRTRKKNFRNFRNFKQFIINSLDQFNWILELNFNKEVGEPAMMVRTERWLSAQRLKNKPDMRFLIIPKIVSGEVVGMICLLGGCPTPNNNRGRLTSFRMGEESFIYNLTAVTGEKLVNSLCSAQFEFVEKNYRTCARGVPLKPQNYTKPLLTLHQEFATMNVLEEAH